MNKIDGIENYFCQGDDTYGTFDCPKCDTTWGYSRHLDPPSDMVEEVRCTCNAILQVSGEWASRYWIDAELVDE